MRRSKSIEKLLDRDHTLVAIETDDAQAIIKKFHANAEYSGAATYIWESGNALVRSGMQRTSIPNTASFEGALDYIDSRPCYGIYVFSGVSEQIESYDIVRFLAALADADTKNSPVLIFIDSRVPKHPKLKGKLAKIRYKT
ncbi:MAG: hypothetical protein KZQ58_08880 [gamma proteobacterium symbiont of Bathyaustriella thionipta]|nr:hypothetical protein [gamma proteobacterium symbiont of Bathyaustriella thionipta]